MDLILLIKEKQTKQKNDDDDDDDDGLIWFNNTHSQLETKQLSRTVELDFLFLFFLNDTTDGYVSEW